MVCVVVRRCVNLEGMCLYCESIFVFTLVSGGWGCVCSNTYIQDDMRTCACVLDTRLTPLMGPVNWGPCGMTCGVLGSMDTSVPTSWTKSLLRAGGTQIMLLCPWKSRWRVVGCGPMWVLACPHMLV